MTLKVQLWHVLRTWLWVCFQNTTISMEYVDFWPKILLFRNPQSRNPIILLMLLHTTKKIFIKEYANFCYRPYNPRKLKKFSKNGLLDSTLRKGDLLSESFSLWLKPPKRCQITTLSTIHLTRILLISDSIVLYSVEYSVDI